MSVVQLQLYCIPEALFEVSSIQARVFAFITRICLRRSPMTLCDGGKTTLCESDYRASNFDSSAEAIHLEFVIAFSVTILHEEGVVALG